MGQLQRSLTWVHAKVHYRLKESVLLRNNLYKCIAYSILCIFTISHIFVQRVISIRAYTQYQSSYCYFFWCVVKLILFFVSNKLIIY